MFNQLIDEMGTQVKSNFGQTTASVGRTRVIIFWAGDMIIKIGCDGVVVQIELKENMTH